MNNKGPILYAETIGNGDRTIVFIHGNSQSHSIWDKVILEIPNKESYSLISVDLPGHGASFRSDEPEKDYSIQGMSSKLKNFIIDAVPTESEFIVVATSLGTNLVGEIADTFSKCRGFFFVSPCIIGSGFTTSDLFQPNPNIAPFFTANPKPEDLNNLLDDLLVSNDYKIREEIKADYLKTDSRFRENWFASVLKAEYTDEIAKLKSTGKPIAILFGEQEKFCNTSYLNNSSLNLWKAQTILIPNAGHATPYDNPSAIAALLTEFIDDIN